MDSEVKIELDEMIKDFEKNIENFPAMGISNYDFLRLLYFLKAAFSEPKTPGAS